MKAFALSAVLAIAATGTALAVDVPTGSRYDARIQYVNYNAGDVVLVRALPGLGSRIVFAPGEQIINAASGFTEGWEFKAAGNMLFIKPKSVKISDKEVMRPEAGKWNTNLMVTTTLRIYDFDLKLLPGNSSGEPAKNQAAAYRVEFRYPGEGWGLTKAALAACDQALIIPMARGVDSLNVAASSAVAFWQLFRP